MSWTYIVYLKKGEVTGYPLAVALSTKDNSCDLIAQFSLAQFAQVNKRGIYLIVFYLSNMCVLG